MQSYPLHTHNVVLFLVSSWKQTFVARRVVLVEDRAWENIDLAALLFLSSLLHLLQITAITVTVTILLSLLSKLSNYFAIDHFAADN